MSRVYRFGAFAVIVAGALFIIGSVQQRDAIGAIIGGAMALFGGLMLAGVFGPFGDDE